MALSLADYPAKYESRVLRKAYAACYNEKAQLFINDFAAECAPAKGPSKGKFIDLLRSLTYDLNLSFEIC